jgi:hypothetical protein
MFKIRDKYLDQIQDKNALDIIVDSDGSLLP